MIDLLQKHWLNNELVGLDSLIYSNGDVVNIDIEYKKDLENPYTFNKQFSLYINGNTNLDALINQFDNDIWSEIQINDKVIVNDFYIICGEGALGNEGFIVKTDLNNNIEWSLYSTTSNPFIKIYLHEKYVYIQSSFNFWILINVHDNKDISILNHQPQI